MVLLVRYGELSLKSPYVRRQLEDRLATNVQEMFAASGVECVVRRERGRVFVHAEDEAAATLLLRRVFGIVSISPAKEATSDLEKLTAFVVDDARALLKPGMTFAIRPQRSGQHPYTSQDLARRLGQAVRDGIPRVAVDLDAPDREIHVEVRGRRAYVFHEIVEGPGGLPLGSQGEALAAVHDDAGLVAAWLVMRRGCRVAVAAEGAYAEALRRWDPRLETLPAGQGPDLARLAAQRGVRAIVVSSFAAEPAPRAILTLTPLAGLAAPEIADLARRIENPV